MSNKTFTAFPDLSLLPDIFKKYSGIQAVYLFGSVAVGKTHAESDLDLAIIPDDASLRSERLELLTELARRGFSNVDLVFLDTNNVVLKFEAIHQNHLLYCKNDFDAGNFFSLTLRQYFDFLPYLKTQREAYKRRVLHDGQDRSYP
jgi:predicted nucleotidyltransferase